MDRDQLLTLYRNMLLARGIDRIEQELTSRGEAFFHLSGGGHEGTAVLANHLTTEDWLHCHYRDRALLVARGLSPRTFFDTLLCNEFSPGSGRRMSAFFNDPELHILSMVTPTGNNALQAVGAAAAIKEVENTPLVYCGVGDGTTQQGEWLEAVGEAVRSSLPVLFMVQDNKWAISTTTQGKTFYSLPDGKQATDFFGMPIHYINGTDVVTANRYVGEIVAEIRATSKPALIVFEVERLTSHTNADDQTVYRNQDDIDEAQLNGDPIRSAKQQLLSMGLTESELNIIQSQVDDQLAAAEQEALDAKTPLASLDASRQHPVEVTHPSKEKFGSDDLPQINMKEALREVLTNHLLDDSRVTLYGEDIEDPKGDVFGVTKGLSTRFPGRVMNSPLSESTIVGAAIGRAMVGQRPVAFIQFADFMPTAYNQIVNELATIHWRTDGQTSVPVIVMIACGGYRPGLGPYHAQTHESVMAHCPGVDVVMPSSAHDAAGLLNAAFKSERPTIFFYPKTLLNDSKQSTSENVHDQFVPLGVGHKKRSGRDITIVGWGNTVSVCEKTADALEQVGIESDVIDLRCLTPWDQQLILSSAEKTARLIVVHEDNQTCGLGSEIVATVAENAKVPVAVRRVTRPDTFIPCNFENQTEVLPGFKRTLAVAAELLNLDLDWEEIPVKEAGVEYIEAIGSGPADESVEVIEILIQPGEEIECGDPVATVEATKSVFEITSPVDGVVSEILCQVGETVKVGAAMLKLSTDASIRPKPITQEQHGRPILTRRKSENTIVLTHSLPKRRAFEVGLSQVQYNQGSKLITNEFLLGENTEMTNEDIIRRTGIRQRYWVDQNEDAISMAVGSCQKVLEQEGLLIDDIDLLICSTTSPMSMTPSMACRILNGLSTGKETMIQAYDISAACSGYLYALQSGYDFLQSTPNGRVLITTAEVLSPLLDLDDFDTSILFGDAATATVLYGESHFEKSAAKLHRPALSAKGEDGTTLSVPLRNSGFIQMKGRRVFQEAVRCMMSSLNRVCTQDELQIEELDLVVPHQANQRIIDAIQHRISPTVFSNIAQHGNTSSSTIPLCLSEVLPAAEQDQKIGLCAFGGGFTFGAGIIKTL
ncbi:MAG: transketolase [Planctomycetaceae bacterium]|nr:transketolase [Planctomycetaceae bacterium]